MIKLCVFDIDGTLVAKKSQEIGEHTIETLQNLKKQGIKIAIASGRPPFAIDKRILDHVDFDYFICSNGACVLEGNGDVVHQYTFTKTLADQLIERFRSHDYALQFQCMDTIHVYNRYTYIANMLKGFLGRTDYLINATMEAEYVHKDLPLAAVAQVNDDQIDNFKETFPELTFTPFAPCHYDINGQHTKADGILHICEKLHCTYDDVAAFGDDFNDESMLLKCGYGIAMGNAKEEMKQIANYVTKNSEDDGIYEACKYYGWI